MKISEIVSKILGLEKSVAEMGADKSKVNDSALSLLAGEVSSLKLLATEKLEKKSGEADSANQKVLTVTAEKDKAQSDLTAVNAALKTSCAALDLKISDMATNAEMITAMQGAVSGTLSRLQVNSAKVPAAVPTNAAGEKVAKKSLDQEIKDRRAATATK